MRWVEEVSTIAARRVSPNVSWASAGIDSLTFKVSALPGWVVYVRAAVLKVYHSSVEIAAVVTCGALVLLLLWLACFADIGVPDDCESHAEDRNSHTPGIKHVSESFFTMVSLPRCSRKPPPLHPLSRCVFGLPFVLSSQRARQVAVDPDTGRPLKGALRQVRLPSGPITEMAASAERRREDRLLEKRVLQRYGKELLYLRLGCLLTHAPFCPAQSVRMRYLRAMQCK